MPAAYYDFDPNKTVYQNFSDSELRHRASRVKCWRYSNTGNGKDIHFASIDRYSDLFTAIAYIDVVDSKEEPRCGKSWLYVKVVDMNMGFVEPLHPAVQRYYDEHKDEVQSL